MTMLTDEVLMYYVDETLDPSERERVETLLASDPDARDRLEGFRITGRVLAELMHRHGAPSEPKRLVDRVLPRKETAPAVAVHQAPRRRSGWLVDRLGERFLPAAGFALAATLTLGTAAGWFARGPGDMKPAVWSDLVQVERSHIRARAPLRDALEKLPGGASAKLADGGGRVRVQLTFRNEKREYCREYEIKVPPAARYGGIACRNGGGEWSVLLQALLAPSHHAGAIVPAGSRAAPVDAAALALMDGDPLAAADEAAAIAKGWRE